MAGAKDSPARAYRTFWRSPNRIFSPSLIVERKTR